MKKHKELIGEILLDILNILKYALAILAIFLFLSSIVLFSFGTDINITSRSVGEFYNLTIGIANLIAIKTILLTAIILIFYKKEKEVTNKTIRFFISALVFCLIIISTWAILSSISKINSKTDSDSATQSDSLTAPDQITDTDSSTQSDSEFFGNIN
ncbi:MAG: hypothetical protein CEN91_164 [Candidatus Berkelbacteria bacterium Licking1014_85]|uniref:Uncharacterized protein n=1 Tax=Candidatus Berkelbacteria bacterium Licking1014_85 TaxID=2017148 RepID=A0A554LLA5_9BACT|nr:MAG: hypothetical protein CEN91_164 [Candidatus Berkelbacteria bacterium Licking1014_85]